MKNNDVRHFERIIMNMSRDIFGATKKNTNYIFWLVRRSHPGRTSWLFSQIKSKLSFLLTTLFLLVSLVNIHIIFIILIATTCKTHKAKGSNTCKPRFRIKEQSKQLRQKVQIQLKPIKISTSTKYFILIIQYLGFTFET